MTQTTHSSPDINLSFYCFQPLSYVDDSWKDILSSDTSLRKIKIFTSNSKPSWFNDMNTDAIFDHTYIIKLKQISSGMLKLDLNKHIEISKNLDIGKTQYYLIFDARFMYFTLVYEIHFCTPYSEINSFLQFSKKGLYNTIRNTLNKDTNSSKIGSWATHIRNEAIQSASKVIKSTLGYKSRKLKNLISIDNNTCNITCLVDIQHSLSNNTIEEISHQFIKHNLESELKQTNQDTIPLGNSNSFLYFNGRFHTIFSYKVNNSYQYISIQYHVQYMWFFLLKINFILSNINFEISTNSSTNNIKTMDTLDVLISKVELLNIYNERYKSALEKTVSIYSEVEKIWNIEKLLTTSNRYIRNFSDHMERLAFKGITKKQSRQNTLLLILSTIQFFALISVWNDYIGINNLPENKFTKFTNIFSDFNFISQINYYLPLILISVIILFSLIFFNAENIINSIKIKINKMRR